MRVRTKYAQGREHERRGLAGNTRDRQQNAGHDARLRRAHSDLHDHDPLGRAERGSRFGQRIGHQTQDVFRRANHHRDNQQRQRNHTGGGGEMPHRLDHRRIDEQADHDGRRRQ